ncbi:DNA-processing protein DprA [Amycolatopsis albispora]|uniref:DNA processing protein DprA n=1 Tax=Amycolatopsis albispora TaxID=1804986 RepID=A0A344L874_9PSEU|nr:DNA-processing protein DprA [Amycolatopsis albispora]AXB44248.1 DNA processing protein DprA [Amycolatopsis albispora]
MNERRADPEIRLARAYLLRVAEPPATALAAFIRSHGPLEAAKLVREGACPNSVLSETAARRTLDFAERDLAEAARRGARLVVPEDGEWPAWPLLPLDQATARGKPGLSPPIGLWVRGDGRLDEAVVSAVAIVGARAATGYGEHTATELAYGLVRNGMPVFSGAAYGIDGAAHRGAIAAGGPTAAVLGCGLDAGYPAGHTALLNKIAACGLVISEYPFGTPPARHRFLVRNRLIAGLTEGTVVVEAGIRSGARNTATTAGVLGKVVMAVPGPVGSSMSAGCHQLIRESAASLVGSLDDVLETVGKLGASLAGRTPRPRRSTDGLGEEALRVHGALELREARYPERIATDSGVPIDRVRSVLPELELEGLAVRSDDGWRLTSRSRPVSPLGGA